MVTTITLQNLFSSGGMTYTDFSVQDTVFSTIANISSINSCFRVCIAK